MIQGIGLWIFSRDKRSEEEWRFACGDVFLLCRWSFDAVSFFKMIARSQRKLDARQTLVFAELQNFSDLYFVTASKGSIRLTKFCCKFFKVAINSGPTNKAINKTFWEHPIFVTHPVRFKITYYYCYQGNGGNSRMEKKLEKFKEI